MAVIPYEANSNPFPDLAESYALYKFAVSKKQMDAFVFIFALFNLFLLVPDLMHVTAPSNILIIVLRILFTLTLVALFFQLKRIESFRTLCRIVSCCELFALSIFLFVLSRYNDPNMYIQTLGIITITISIFLIPNRLRNMIGISVFGAICYLAYIMLYTTVVASFAAATAVYLAIDIALCAIVVQNAERHQYNEYVAKTQLEYIGYTDHLTLTFNRQKLEEEAVKWIDFCHRHTLSLCLVFVDVDGLKQINDVHGHLAGDTVLVDLSKLIAAQSRKEDVIARWGGDEFVLLLPCIKLGDAVVYSERIRRSIEENEVLKKYGVTCSFGVVEMSCESSVKELIQKADALLYAAKLQNKNNVRCSE